MSILEAHFCGYVLWGSVSVCFVGGCGWDPYRSTVWYEEVTEDEDESGSHCGVFVISLSASDSS